MFTEHQDLSRFWQAAKLPIPTLIVGGGRWAKVWVSVILAARGSIEDIVLVARTHPDSVREWTKRNQQFARLCVYSSITEAVEKTPNLKAAIICSRPMHHLRDTLEVIAHNLHVLVEKPISTDATAAAIMLEAALVANRVFAVGTEFAYLPALHQCVKKMNRESNNNQRFFLHWSDPVSEMLHGSIKVRHVENSLLNDLLPHAFSIFYVLASKKKEIYILNAVQSQCGQKGFIHFSDEQGGEYKLLCDVDAQNRKRLVEIHDKSFITSVDFSTEKSIIKVDNSIQEIDTNLAYLTSTLRLELGAFVSAIEKQVNSCEAGGYIQTLISLQRQLEKFYPLNLNYSTS